MKPITNRSQCGAMAPDYLTFSVISLPKKRVKAPYCLLKPVKEKTVFPLFWLCLLACLLLCNTVMAADVSREIRDYYLQQILEGSDHTQDDGATHLGLEFRIKGEGDKFEIGYTSRSNWQLGFEQIALGRDNFLFSELPVLALNEWKSLAQEVGEYEGWGAKLGYRYELTPRLSSSIHLGGFNWKQYSHDNLNQWYGEQSGVSPYGGVGLEYTLNAKASFRFNWQHFELNSDSFDDFAIRLDYRF
ncbi:outer membrane beta-barrel protein [Shewanella woodyi]|uniref:outer membrane beta-barrel protein n=1 Tax=Shewanella woodyi TaxID=60961 RepID=UPI0007F94074|nr:outer membrane beta-barrel protein [Shewanella woodyi]